MQTSVIDDELRARVLERPDRLLHDAVVREALDAVRILRARDPEQEDRLHADRGELARLAGEPVDRDLVDTRHRRHRPSDSLAGNDEQRVNEVAGLERRLADEIAQRRRPAQPARTSRPRRVRRASSGWNDVMSCPRSATRAPE